jgi:hypothetical protein
VKLVKGLAAVVEALGVVIHESTPVTEIRPKHAVTPYGTVRAPYVLRCTEGFTASLKGQRRTWLPMNSSMIATEPLSDAQWESVGWGGLETLGDMAHAYMYAQRTADGRIALGGRGVPYRFGSRTDNDGRTQAATVEALREILVRFFPSLGGAGRACLVGGAGGAARLVRDGDVGSVDGAGVGGGLRRLWGGYDESRCADAAGSGPAGLGAGGATDLTGLPWVGHKVRKWEPEPLRWLGVQGMYGFAWSLWVGAAPGGVRPRNGAESVTHRLPVLTRQPLRADTPRHGTFSPYAADGDGYGPPDGDRVAVDDALAGDQGLLGRVGEVGGDVGRAAGGGDRVEEGRTDRTAHLLGGVDGRGGHARVLRGDSGRGGGEDRHEDQAHAEAHQQQAGRSSVV